MCRLLAYAAPRPAAVEELIGARQCRTYQLMAQLHDDGWGTAWLDESSGESVVHRLRTVLPGHEDELLRTVMDRPLSRARIFHLRLATDRMAVQTTNSHPFHGDGLAFAHNGSIAPTPVLRAMVGPVAMEGVEGTTDSELYFALVREGTAAGMSLTDAVAAAVARIRTAYPAASLNSVTMSSSEMVVVNSSSAAPLPLWEIHQQPGSVLPDEHDERYFTMRYLLGQDGSFVVASAGLDTSGWNELPQDSITQVDLSTMTVTVRALGEVPVELYPAA
ncbi:class II glutamine amidotransferase [Austwickia chelonae]|uniref:class II glutamine amidotransferase n=1 Tax=Austwickia chelonae TaxID=100225 RepID=UPI000E258A4E|nr:class II glutamine amidotransferase [Austwickia chelonae]